MRPEVVSSKRNRKLYLGRPQSWSNAVVRFIMDFRTVADGNFCYKLPSVRKILISEAVGTAEVMKIITFSEAERRTPKVPTEVLRVRIC
ncbi:MAG: hypothetical protein ACTS6G_04920 [Candidatus Hodgkinia cicadicola]